MRPPGLCLGGGAEVGPVALLLHELVNCTGLVSLNMHFARHDNVRPCEIHGLHVVPGLPVPTGDIG
eukprot:8331745-Pyramimonas_sp.AAC.1